MSSNLKLSTAITFRKQKGYGRNFIQNSIFVGTVVAMWKKIVDIDLDLESLLAVC